MDTDLVIHLLYADEDDLQLLLDVLCRIDGEKPQLKADNYEEFAKAVQDHINCAEIID